MILRPGKAQMLLPLMLMVARMTLVLLLLWLHTVPFARQGHPR
jgi:hypothetical protein